MKNNYYIWIEIQANKEYITNKDKFTEVMEHCKENGVGSVVLSVKDTTGFAIFKGSTKDGIEIPHYSIYDAAFENQDYLSECISIIHSLGMKIYAAFDVFAEGNKKHPHPQMPGLKNEGWMTEVYGLDSDGIGKIQSVADTQLLKTIGSIDDFGEVFVNPANDAVCHYEMQMMQVVIENYAIDGIVLDRVRYVGLSSDFSKCTKEKWELWAGISDEKWPQDIYTLKKTESDPEIQYGKYFGLYLTFRAKTISDFVKNVRTMIDGCSKKMDFFDYTGSWYPLYYQVGANWASTQYAPFEYSWVNAEQYAKTGYIDQVDKMLSGFYYEDITKEEAIAHKKPAYWYSVEGSFDLAYQVTRGEKPIVGSLFLQQYGDKLENIKKAIDMCFAVSDGCMLFDLSYLIKNNWWNYIKIED